MTTFELNQCSWIILNKSTNCPNKLALSSNKYCSYHAYLIRNGSKNRVCSECGIGVKSIYNFCKNHGKEFKTDRARNFNKKHNSIRAEFKRLSKIKCF